MTLFRGPRRCRKVQEITVSRALEYGENTTGLASLPLSDFSDFLHKKGLGDEKETVGSRGGAVFPGLSSYKGYPG